MNKIILNTGLWSGIICLTSFLIWIVSFTGIAITSPLFYWTNIDDYSAYVNNNSQFFQYLAKSFMIVFALGYMGLLFVYHEFVADQRKILSKIAVALSIMFTLLASTHYYVQVSAVRFAIHEGHIEGLEHFLQAKPTSVLSSLNMLAWTIFLSLSSLFIYLSLRPDTLTKAIRIGLLMNTISCMIAGAGYLFRVDLVTFLFINIGMGAAFLVITISSIRFFAKLKNE